LVCWLNATRCPNDPVNEVPEELALE
jgi:hypothetical protein